MSADEGLRLDLTPNGRVLLEYLRCEGDVVLVQGHRASLKSSTSCDKLFVNAAQQPVGKDGVRRRRTYIVRNTFDELKRTTIKTWLTKFPESRYGQLKMEKPPVHRIRVADLDWEVIFLAIDREDDAKKLLSSEASDAWVNEFREVPRRVIEDLGAVVGRYPDPLHPFRPQILGDTNAPSADHWFAVMSGQATMPDNLGADERAAYEVPKGWYYFIQPQAMFEVLGDGNEVVEYRHNPEREGRRFVADAYFDRLLQGRPRSWIRVNILNKPGMLADGDAVYPRYREHVHKAERVLEPVEGHVIMAGLDFGRTPAAVFGQRVFGRWRILRELCAFGTSAAKFAPIVKAALAEWFPGHSWIIYGDPAGEDLAQADDISPFLMFAAAGLPVYPAPSNDPLIRRAALEGLLDEAPEGVPSFQVSPRCVRLNAALAGDYHYPRVKGTGREQTIPIKNAASHVAEACEYVIIGAGEGRALLTPAAPRRPVRPSVPPSRRGWERLRARSR